MNVPLKKRYNYGQINESLSSGATNGNPVTAGIYPSFVLSANHQFVSWIFHIPIKFVNFIHKICDILIVQSIFIS